MFDTIMYFWVKENDTEDRSPRLSLHLKPSCSKVLQEQAYYWYKPEVVCYRRRLRKNTVGNLASTSCSQCRIASRDGDLKRKSTIGFGNISCDSDRVHVGEGLTEEYLQRV